MHAPTMQCRPTLEGGRAVALRIILTLLMTAATAAIAGWRILWLVKLIRSGTAAPGRGKPGGEPGRQRRRRGARARRSC